MKYAIDETELARLEELACAAGDADYSAHDDADDSTKYAAAACNAVPALVAEIRRLRTERLHLEETARVLAEQVGKGNIGKIQRALEWADEEAKRSKETAC